MICYTHITYMKVCMGWISYFLVQAVQKLDGIPQIHCGVWEKKKWKRKETFFLNSRRFFFLKKDFECYNYKKKKVEISIGKILVPCWFNWFFIVRLYYYFINIKFLHFCNLLWTKVLDIYLSVVIFILFYSNILIKFTLYVCFPSTTLVCICTIYCFDYCLELF